MDLNRLTLLLIRKPKKMIITNLIGYSHGSQPPWQLFAGWGRGWCGEEFGICIFVFCIQLYICVLYLVVYFCFVLSCIFVLCIQLYIRVLYLVVYFCFVVSCIFAFYIQLYICIIHSMPNNKIFTAKHFDISLFLNQQTNSLALPSSFCTSSTHDMKEQYIQAKLPLQNLGFNYIHRVVLIIMNFHTELGPDES